MRIECLPLAAFHGCLGPFSVRSLGCPLGVFGRLREVESVEGVAERESGLRNNIE